MSASLRYKHLREVATADEYIRAGDFYITQIEERGKDTMREALILKCPFCGMDMTTIPIHQIKRATSLKRFLSKFGFSLGISISPKLQCPYVPTHIFTINNGKVII